MEDLGAKFGGPRERLDYGPIAKHVGRKFDFLLRAIDQLDISCLRFSAGAEWTEPDQHGYAPMARSCVRWQCLTQFYFSTVAQHEDWVCAAALAALGDRHLVISAAKDGIKVTHLTGAPVWARPEYPVASLAVARVGTQDIVVAGCHDGNVRLWDLAEGIQVGHTFGGHGGEFPTVRAVQVTTLDQRAVVISAGNDGIICLWDLERQELLFEPIEAFSDCIQDIALGLLSGRPLLIGTSGTLLRICVIARNGDSLPPKSSNASSYGNCPLNPQMSIPWS